MFDYGEHFESDFIDEYCSPIYKAYIEIDECYHQQKKNLNLDRLGLDLLPFEIQKLSNLSSLKRLDLSQNKFSFLPSEIGLLTSLQEFKLCLNFRVPFKLPPQIGKLTQLVNLKLSGNSLESLPEEISNLISLRIVDFSNNQLKYLTKDFVKLEKLGKLRADNNRLESLPKLPMTINQLALSYNPKLAIRGEWFDSISYLTGLSQLELRGCNVTSWPKGIEQLVSLRVLDLGDNKIPTIGAQFCSQVTTLTKLLIDQNLLTTLPDEIGAMTSLLTLNLKQNNILELPLSFRHLSALDKDFHIDAENIRMPPKEVVKQGCKNIRQFLESLVDGSSPCYRTKLLVVGQENVGKTSLVRQLRNPSKSVKKAGAVGVSKQVPPISTDGIDIENLNFACNIAGGQKISLELSVWDFAGQEIYYTTHQFFLTGRSIFLIVFDLRYDATHHSRVEFWLQSIVLRAGDVSVLLVGTHADDKKFKEEGSLQSALEDIATEFVDRFPCIKLITAISCLDGQGIEELKAEISKEALKMKHIGEILPKPYMLLESAISNLKEERKLNNEPPIVQWSEFINLAAACHIHSPDALTAATSFLHDLGVLLHYTDEGHDGLNQMVVIDPQWLIDMASQIITTKHNFCKRGILRHIDLDQIWKSPLFPKELHMSCLNIMRKFGISYEVEGNVDIIPCLLPEDRPDISILWLQHDPNRTQFDRIWQYEFLPTGLFSTLLIRLKYLTTVHRFWRNGVVVSRGSNWALVEVLPLRRSISISVRTDDNYASLLVIINDIIKQLMDNWYKVSAKQFVPCSHCIENQSYDPWLFSVDECEEGLLKEQYYVICQRRKNYFSNIQIERLIPDLSLKEYERYKINISEIQLEDKHLAEGAYGLLYRGIWNDQTVAVKILRSDEIMEEKLAVFKEFRKEVSIMSELKHQNLVELKGFSVSGGKPAMIMEFMKHGDLYSIIKPKSPGPITRLPLQISLNLATDIAKGIEFLHSLTPPILHRDLKPPNILITKEEGDQNYTAKVADFGLSAKQYLSNLKERAVETPIWVAPEILKKEPYTTKSDVYSYAIILYEIFERKLPFENVEFRFLNELEEQIIKGSRSDITQLNRVYPEIASLIEDCWNGDPYRRPNFSEIINRLIDITEKYEPSLSSILSLSRRSSLPPPEAERVQNPKINVRGKWMKRLQLDNPDCVFVLTLVGSEVWSAHRNGDIAIWSAENGKLLRQIIAAHSREIRSMILVGSNVWTGCRDGLIKLWRARSLCDENLIRDNNLILKEGFVDCSDGKNHYCVLRHGDAEFAEIKLELAKVFPLDDQKRSCFAISSNNSVTQFYARTIQDRDEWVKYIAIVINNLSEETQDLFIAQITPRKRRDEINTLLYYDGLVYVGYSSDLMIRAYDSKTLECKKEQLLTENSWKSVRVQYSARKMEFAGSRLSPQTRSYDSRAEILDDTTPLIFNNVQIPTTLSALEPNIAFINCLYYYNGSIWTVVNHLIFRLDPKHLRPITKLIGHTSIVQKLAGIDDTLWSCSNDCTLRVWDIKKGNCLKVLNCGDLPCSIALVGNTIWCGEREQISIWSTEEYIQTKVLKRRHTDKVVSLILVWDRVVWSGSVDKSICVWS